MARSQWAAIAASLAAITFAGCGARHEPSGIYKTSDAERLAGVAPVTPEWPPWPKEPEQPTQSSSESAEQEAAPDPIEAEYRRKTAGIEQPEDWFAGSRWSGNGKIGNLVVGVFDTSADAHVALVAWNDQSRAYGAKYDFVARAETVDGLGDEAWRLWAGGYGRQVTYHWRRDNLVTEVHVHCYGECPSHDYARVDAAARAWADAIDDRARSGRG